MKIDSPLFDSIRVKPDHDRRRHTGGPACEWPKCKSAATHKAPKGRGEGAIYWRFCLDHVREYNASYNFFAGMSDSDIASYQKDAMIGHRPTWKMGMNGGKPSARSHSARFQPDLGGADDPLGLFRHFGARAAGAKAHPEEARVVHNAERKALDVLGLEPDTTISEIKVRFKALVKRHHPDVNGGDRSTEDRLREIIQAYKYLKTVRLR
jgi:DnaJ domain